MSRRVGDWMKLNLGDRVIDQRDPRHVGRVDAIRNGYEATIRWDDSGYVSYVPLHHLQRVERRRLSNA